MNYFKVSIGIFLALALSRFVPHPPNFTSLIALSFYVPVILGTRYIPALLLCFFVTDMVIGFHSLTFFTWGSVLVIGLISNYFKSSLIKRISGSLIGALIFFVITNFGVWVLGSYGYTLSGLISCYILAIPFFTYNIISTLLFSGIIEMVCKLKPLSAISLDSNIR